MLSTPASTVALDLPLDWRVLSFAAVVALVTAACYSERRQRSGGARQQPNDTLKAQMRTVVGENHVGRGTS